MADVLWKDCVNWLIRCQVLPPDHRVTWRDAHVKDFAFTLRDGVLLCQILNRLVNGCIDIKEISLRPQMSQFLCSKNIRSFLHACQNVFDLKEEDLFDPNDLFEYANFAKVLHTLSILSKSDKAEQSGIKGFPTNSRSHDYYNDEIYRNLEDFANHNEDPMVQIELPTTPRRSKEEDIYEDLCYVTLRITESNIPTVTHAPLEKKDYCIKELEETEKNYIEALNMIIKHFMRPLKLSIRDEDRKVIFKNIKELAEIHTGFHSELYKACTSPHYKISDCFHHWKEKFIIYGDYCCNLPHAQELIDELCTKNESINQAINRCQTEANNGKFKLRDLLSVPMQRILKYHLLLKELIKNTAKTHEDYYGLEKALDDMIDLAQYINEVKRDNETLQIIRDIQASITDLTMPENTSLKDYGRLLNDGDLKIKSHQVNKTKNRYVFVFDKVMLMCKLTKIMDKLLGSEQYSFKEALVLNDYCVDTSSPKTNNRDKGTHHWHIVHNSKKVAYTLYAKTEECKNKWITAIQKALDNVNPAAAMNSDHTFEMYSFEHPSHCAECDKLLRGIYFQGYKCTTCGMAVHKSCLETIHACGAPSLPPRPSQIVENNFAKVTARIAFRALQPGQLSFEENDIIYVFRKANSHWWEGYVKRTGEKGMFPVDCVESTRGITYENPFHTQKINPSPATNQNDGYTNLNLEEYEWFVGIMDRDEATVKLKDLPSGTFLLRISPKQNGGYAISLIYNNQIKHMRVCCTDDGHLYYLSRSKYFKSIAELILWYKENSLAESFECLHTTLAIPFKRAFVMTNSNSSSPVSLNESSDPVPVRITPISIAVALLDFTATSANMINLKKGDQVAVLSKAGSTKGWWKGSVDSQVGYFPASYVTEVEE
ncbi:VAV2 [Cordylochernes scorpioides]|uniref:VAV2 n=1 Tax=Cordylochernes scorpioides TaxID=51811 RepID=A0ABY6KMG3_9ARAC|nr:VAV2 [Cordylochernes scorpioides]